jgi:hypothetical protein
MPKHHSRRRSHRIRFLRRHLFALSTLLVPSVLPVAPTRAAIDAPATRPAPAELVEVRKIWDAAPHNAFTDLRRWHDRWWCTFREGPAHVGGGDGTVRVLTSADGAAWESAALLAEAGIDLRDPKLSVTPGDKLMLVMGGSVYRGGKVLLGCQPRVAFSGDGRTWTEPTKVLAAGDWLWQATWNDGVCYGTTYRAWQAPAAGNGPATAPAKRPHVLTLVKSKDGLAWEPVAPLAVPDDPNETTLRFRPTGEMVALVRRDAGDAHGYVGVAKPPYTDWAWKETAFRVGGPNFLVLPSGAMIAGTRDYTVPRKPTTAIAAMTTYAVTPILTLPSGGDTSYPGLAWHDGLLWVSYYASHEGKASIYLAKVKPPESMTGGGPAR